MGILWTVTHTRMVVAFWSAIAFCAIIILIYFSYLKYRKHRQLKRHANEIATCMRGRLPTDPHGQRRLSPWRTTPRGPQSPMTEEFHLTSMPQSEDSQDVKDNVDNGEDIGARPVGDV